jgi:hypothetical protein
MLKRQGKGESMGAPVRGEAVIGMLSASDPDGPAGTWDPPRRTLDGGFNSIDNDLSDTDRRVPSASL